MFTTGKKALYLAGKLKGIVGKPYLLLVDESTHVSTKKFAFLFALQ